MLILAAFWLVLGVLALIAWRASLCARATVLYMRHPNRLTGWLLLAAWHLRFTNRAEREAKWAEFMAEVQRIAVAHGLRAAAPAPEGEG